MHLTLHPSTQSTGDYYSCASLSGAPVPTAGIISRGIAAEGIGVIMSGLWGTGCGTTSYAENIGAIALTGVGSRAVVQCGAITMMILSVFAKFGKERCSSFISFYTLIYTMSQTDAYPIYIGVLLASMPHAMASGLYCVVFAMIVSVGLSNLKHIDLDNQRNLFILGFSIFNSLRKVRVILKHHVNCVLHVTCR